MRDFIPSERLKVFISSAQNDENGFSWTETRKRIKEYMERCPYLNPFIIEDCASRMQSEQFYQRQIVQSDIVVMLVKGDVRKGTQREFSLCMKLRKPLYIYFLDDVAPSQNVNRIRNILQNQDYCTYRKIKDPTCIEKEIQNDIIEDVIRYYQDSVYMNVKNENEPDELSFTIESSISNLGIPRKTSLALFQSCYSYFFELLDINVLEKNALSEISEYHELGKMLIKWLINGDIFDCDKLPQLVDGLKNIYQNTDWLKHRWEAIWYEINGESQRALEEEQVALDLAKKLKSPQWIINNILIDCRNIESEIEYINKSIPISYKAQEELNSQETIVFLPVVDRYLNQIYGEITKEEHTVTTASYKSLTFSNRLQLSIYETANYFFSSVLYGSYTHIVETRNILSYILNKFSQFNDSYIFMFETIKLQILNGDCKKFRSLVLAHWDNIYLCVISKADELWNVSQKTLPSRKDSMKLNVFRTVGLYLSDIAFTEAEKFLFSYSKKVYWGNSEEYFDSILNNTARLNQDNLINLLSDIIMNQQFHLGGTLSKIILSVDFTSVSMSSLKKLKSALLNHLPYIIQNNGNPQLITALILHDKDLFGELEMLPNNGLVGLERTYFELNTGLGNWMKLLEVEIESARKQFEYNLQSNIYASNGYSFFEAISNIIRKSEISSEDRINNVLCEQFMPLAVELLNSDVNSILKEECIECLCDVLSFMLYKNISIPNDIKNAIQNVNFTNTLVSLPIKSEATFNIKVLMIKLIIGLSDKNDLFSWCVDYNKRPIVERIALANCLEKYLYRNASNPTAIDTLLIFLILQCCDDEYFEIRAIGCKCASYALKSNYREILEEKLRQHSMDASDYVRDSILLLCKSGAILADLSRTLIDAFKNDANYTIRKRALSIDE